MGSGVVPIGKGVDQSHVVLTMQVAYPFPSGIHYGLDASSSTVSRGGQPKNGIASPL